MGEKYSRRKPPRLLRDENGEEIGWKISPFLNGFYYGYLATGDSRWPDMLVRCVDAWISRGIKEPDGYTGWPKVGAAGTNVDHLDDYYADSLLGEAMALTPVVLMAKEMLNSSSLKPNMVTQGRLVPGIFHANVPKMEHARRLAPSQPQRDNHGRAAIWYQ